MKFKNRRNTNRNPLLQYFLVQRNANSGFTLIELLIVIVVIGILSAIALPSFLNQAKKAKQSEAKMYIASMNRGHQAVYLERGAFTTNLNDLGLGIRPETTSYIYRITPGSAAGSGVVNRAIPSDGSFSNTPDNQATVTAYIGGVKIAPASVIDRSTSAMTVLCEAISPPIVSGGDLGTTAEPDNFLSSSPGAPTCDPSTYQTID